MVGIGLSLTLLGWRDATLKLFNLCAGNLLRGIKII